MNSRYDLSAAGDDSQTVTPTVTSIEDIRVQGLNAENAADIITYDGGSTTGAVRIVANGFSGDAAGFGGLAVTNVTTDVAFGIRGGNGNADHSVTYDAVTGADDQATVEFSNEGQANLLTINGIETTSLSVSGTNNSITDISADAVETLLVTGDGAVTVTELDQNNANLTTIDASENSGGATLGADGDFVLGTVTAITGGTGDDTVHLNRVNVAADDTIDGGECVDTLQFDGGTTAAASAIGPVEILVCGPLH